MQLGLSIAPFLPWFKDGEYFLKEVSDILDASRTIHQCSCSYTSAQNGRAERNIAHHGNNSIYPIFSFSYWFWGWGCSSNVCRLNRLPTSLLSGVLHYKLLLGQVSDYSLLCLWLGMFCSFCQRGSNKLSARSPPCIFFGYDVHQKWCKCYDLLSPKLSISHHVVFLGKIPHFNLLKIAPISKEDLVQIYPFSAYVSYDEFISIFQALFFICPFSPFGLFSQKWFSSTAIIP